jgi:hypothetical protein
MNGETWFSTRLRFAIIIESQGLVRYSDSVYLLSAADFDSAFQRALVIGQKNQRQYENADRQQVVWKFAEVLALDVIRADSLDGAEVYSEPVPAVDPSWTINQAFHPEASRPTQTV